MTRVVLDTNLVVSAILSPEGKPARILKMVFDGRLDIAISSAMLKEITLVLNYQKIRKLLAKRAISLEEIKNVLQRIGGISGRCFPTLLVLMTWPLQPQATTRTNHTGKQRPQRVSHGGKWR